MITYKQFVFNPIKVNTWVVHNEEGDCAIFDPGCQSRDEEDLLIEYLDQNNIKPSAIIATHGHFDHILGVSFIRKKYHCPFMGHKDDQILLDHSIDQGRLFGFEFDSSNLILDKLINGEGTIRIGNLEFSTFHIPGHSPGSVVFYNKSAGFVIVGDVLFKGSIGRTDLPGGDYDSLIENIRKYLLPLPDETRVLPGHGSITTIITEKQTNPFL